MYKIIARIETTKNCYEYNKPLLILLDEPANWGLVAYCSATGHGEGDYKTLLKQSRPATEEEATEIVKLYGYYTIKDLKIVKRRTPPTQTKNKAELTKILPKN